MFIVKIAKMELLMGGSMGNGEMDDAVAATRVRYQHCPDAFSLPLGHELVGMEWSGARHNKPHGFHPKN